MTDSARILVVDNYDSFVYTIVGYLKTLGATVTVVRNDAIDPSQPGVIDEYDGVLISPGPGAPAESGASEDMIRLCAKLDKPMFGVCLGMQALADRVLDNILYERRHLNDSPGGAWTKRMRLIGNLARDRWKYGEVYGRSFLLEGLRLSVGYLFDRNPEL